MKQGIKVAVLLISLGASFANADQYNSCGQGVVQGRETLWYEFSWDYWEVVYYPEGFIYVTGTGPVTPAPYSDSFESDEFTLQGNKILAFIDESYELPGIWTITGHASLWRDLGGEPSFPYPGIVDDYCAGAF